jgi:putative MATE family efflux protein
MPAPGETSSYIMLPARLRHVWRRALSLAWPVMAEQTFRTAMRTTDVFVTATFSPAAVVAIGLADLYARFPLRIGLGFGAGAIALSSQDTGRGAEATRDEAISVAVLLGVLLGVPFAVAGWLVGEELIALLGAGPRAVELGGLYLAVVFATAPARHVVLIAARSLQGTGDTLTPMYVNVVANLLTVVFTVGLGLGLFELPRLGVFGVGLATAGANVLTAVLMLAAIASPYTEAAFRRPGDAIIARQLVVVSVPRIAEGFVATLAEFPFNALLLGFGTAVNAGFQIGRRMYQQVTGPLSRGYSVAASVVVGQSVGEGDPGAARYQGWAVAALGLLTVGVVGLLLTVGAEGFVRLFADDPATVAYAVAFARTYGLLAGALVTFVALSGAFSGASETRVPFVARATGLAGFLLGVTYLVGVALGYGPVGAYLGIAGSYLWMAGIVAWRFHRGEWALRAADMMGERDRTAEA